MFSILEKEASSANDRMLAMICSSVEMGACPKIFFSSSGVSCCRTSVLNCRSWGWV